MLKKIMKKRKWGNEKLQDTYHWAHDTYVLKKELIS